MTHSNWKKRCKKGKTQRLPYHLITKRNASFEEYYQVTKVTFGNRHVNSGGAQAASVCFDQTYVLMEEILTIIPTLAFRLQTNELFGREVFLSYIVYSYVLLCKRIGNRLI
jgi:hypothetical protein